MTQSDMSRNKIVIAQCVHDLFRVWARVRMNRGNPVNALHMLTNESMRNSFIESCEVTLGLIWEGELQRKLVHNTILQELVGDRVLLWPDDLKTACKLTAHADEILQHVKASDEELAS